MPLSTPLLPETISNVSAKGQHQELTVAQLTTAYGSGNIKTPTKNFSLVIGGQHITGRKGVPMVLSPELLAALTAAGAPVQ